MLRTVFTKSLRDYRWAILGWGIGLGIVVYAQYATFSSTFTGASATQIQHLVQQFRFFGEAVRVGTPGGFVTFKIMGLMPVILGIWTVLAGARLLRGEEERGTLDILLATPPSRRSPVVQKLLALPGWVVNLSIFHQYGTPILHGLNWTSFAVMLLVAAAMLALAGWEFTVQDVDRGAVRG